MIAIPAAAAPPPGAPDTTFGVAGAVSTALPDDGRLGYWRAVSALDAQGRIVTAGSYSAPGGGVGEDFFVVRHDDSGALDPSFGTDGFTTIDVGRDEYANDVVIDGLGRVVVVGRSTATGDRAVVFRLDEHGSLDPTFDSDGVLESTFGAGVADASGVDVNGTQIVLSIDRAATPFETVSEALVARLNPDGSFDATFGENGVSEPLPASAYGNDVVVDEQARPILGATTSGNSADVLIARYTPAGTFDTTFSDDGITRLDFADRSDFLQELALDARDRIVGGVYASNGATGDDFAAVRVLPSGVPDRSFDGDGKASVDFGTYSDTALAMAVDRNSEIVVVGRTPRGGDERKPDDWGIARFTESGILDKTFSGDGRVRTDFAGRSDWAFDVLFDEADKVIVSGRAVQVRAGSAVPELALVRYMGGPYGTDPSVSMGDAAVREGDRGSKTVYLRVTLSRAPTTAVSVRVKIERFIDRSDIQRVDRLVHLEAGDTAARVPVKVHGDLQRNEGDERYAFLLSNASGALLGDRKGIVTIRSDPDPCDIVGTNGRDRLVGTRGVTCTLGGDDFVDGGYHVDKILGGRGDDVLYGNEANDVLIGGDGRDRLYGGSGTDSFDGGAGFDRCGDVASYERRTSC